MLPPLSKPITLPPIRWIAVSNERRVRVEGSKKQLATTLCLISSGFGCAFSWPAVFTINSNSARESSAMEMMCFW
ncbi:Uncharacterised protein [Vibrio cholerae]|nr:Uncharacterised protein [Vibrio cholerae]